MSTVFEKMHLSKLQMLVMMRFLWGSMCIYKQVLIVRYCNCFHVQMILVSIISSGYLVVGVVYIVGFVMQKQGGKDK